MKILVLSSWKLHRSSTSPSSILGAVPNVQRQPKLRRGLASRSQVRCQGLWRTIKDYQGLSSGFKWIQVAVAQCLSLKVMKLFLKGLDGLDLVGAWGRQSESCAALERNVHYRGITVEIDIHIRYYSIIHVQYVYTYKLYIWIANWNLCKGHPVISTAIQKHDIWLHSLQLPWLHSRLSIQLCSSSCMVLMSSAWPTTHNS